MSKKILIVGCGQLGSRHLQAVASLDGIAEIHILDPREESIKLGKQRLTEIGDVNTSILFKWFTKMDRVSSDGDLCIISTQSAGRSRVLKDVAEKLGYKKFMIEKIVSQSVAEYNDLLDYSRRSNLSVWVNCKTRTYRIHQYIKSKIDADDPILFSVFGGNHGLGNNGVHAADLFLFYDNSDRITITGSKIDPVLHPSKRGKDIFDLSGTLWGHTAKGSELIISFSGSHDSPDHISIVSKKSRFIIDHFQKFAHESYGDDGWEWKRIPINENWAVSCMSKLFAADILAKGSCLLPTLQESFGAHEFILNQLLPHFNELREKKYDYCPVT